MLPKPKKARRLCAPPPNRAPPPLCLFCHPPRCPRIPPDTVSLATLHLYLPNGEFVVEVIQRHDQSVNEFLEKLENGHITPDLHLDPSLYSRPPEWAYYSSAVTIPSYVLVFNAIVLEEYYDWVNVPEGFSQSPTISPSSNMTGLCIRCTSVDAPCLGVDYMSVDGTSSPQGVE